MKILEFLNIFSHLKINIINVTLNYNWKLSLLIKLRFRRKKQKFVIHCIGDSHASFFSGKNCSQKSWPKKSIDKYHFLKSYRLGPVLAYNLCSYKAKSRGREKLFYLLNHILPLGSIILFCFGEIDCRAHLLKQSEIREKDIHEIIRECVDRYFSVIREVKDKGFEVLVFNVTPSSYNSNQREFPFYGTDLERIKVTKFFNQYLKQKLAKCNIIFIDIFNTLVSENNEILDSYYRDSIHLSGILY